MRKIISSSLIFPRNIKKYNQINSLIYQTNISNINTKTLNRSKLLTYQSQYYISDDPQVEVQNKVIVPFKGYLNIRNSQFMDLAFQTSQKVINVLIPKNSTIDQAKQFIKEKLNATDVQFICQQAKIISGFTPFQALLDRIAFLILNNDYSVEIQGQLLRPAVNSNVQQPFRNLQMPLVTRRQIEDYRKRINTWIEAKYGVGFQNSNVKIPKNQVKKLLVQALLDPMQSNKRLLQKQQQFQKVYWQVQQLLDKKSQAVVICSKMVRNRMALGLFLIMGNVLFIWSGTYIYYSWDIIQPIAYFISSLAGIILCSRFFKIKRLFSLFNYKDFMLDKYMPVATRKVGLDMAQLQLKKLQLAQLEAQIKDYYLKKV